MIEIQKINELSIYELDALCDCSLFNYGTMRDYCNKFTYKFINGGIYGIIGEFGAGGWALSYTISGMSTKYEGSIMINDNVVSSRELCYVGECMRVNGLLGQKKMTVLEQIKLGIKAGKCPDALTSNNVIDLFKLSKERVGRRIEYTSGERWKASVAIGYANGKKVFCFPWLNTGEILHLKEHFRLCLNILKQINAIVIIPTCKIESIEDLTSDNIYIKSVYEKMHVTG